ncbi:MAG: lytic murein transglycosylase [Steroidobacteraceae bacterium]
MKYSAMVLLCCGWLGSCAVQATTLDTARPEVQAFIEAASSEHGLDREWVESILARAEPQPDIIELITRPAEKRLTWGEYRQNFLDERRIATGVAFWKEHADRLADVEQQTGVDPRVIVGILGVETRFGRITGRHRVLDALVTLGFDYPPRSEYFLGELGQFLALVRDEGVSPLESRGSYAGAMGFGQFMPRSYRIYAVDGNGDGRRDLFTDWDDAISSIANYLLQHGWRRGEAILLEGKPPEGENPDSSTMDIEVVDSTGPIHLTGLHNFTVIMRYNRSLLYALAVEELGRTVALRLGSDPQ